MLYASNSMVVRLMAGSLRFMTCGGRLAFLAHHQMKTAHRCTVNMSPLLSPLANTVPAASFATGHQTKPVAPLHLQIEKHLGRTALQDRHGLITYDNLSFFSNKLADKLFNILGPDYEATKGKRVAFLCENDASYVISNLATWKIGAICVPLAKSHPPKELQYFIEDSGADCVITDQLYEDKIKSLAAELKVHHLVLQPSDYTTSGRSDVAQSLLDRWCYRTARDEEHVRENIFRDQGALIIYTSGTTGRPKGVLHTHGSLEAQVMCQVEAWQWSPSDVVLHVLPLHHVHGIVNLLHVPLHEGATCVMLPKFDAQQVWSHFIDPPKTGYPDINLFMAVPTVYSKLIEHMQASLRERENWTVQSVKQSCTEKIRLMVSGSASLPRPVMDSWRELTGHTLLERYGMTELGMVLTNPLAGPRIPGSVGRPFPGVEVRIVSHEASDSHDTCVLVEGNQYSSTVTEGYEGQEGDLEVRGPNMFAGYWGRPEATAEVFTKDGWFKTGDTACYRDGGYKILGRSSVDIIKSGGYKISALDIEHHLLAHPDITEISVVGLPDLTWGQKVAAVTVLKENTQDFDLKSLKSWAADVLPNYQIPSILKIVESIPKNAMGKVNKKELVKMLFAKEMNSTV